MQITSGMTLAPNRREKIPTYIRENACVIHPQRWERETTWHRGRIKIFLSQLFYSYFIVWFFFAVFPKPRIANGEDCVFSPEPESWIIFLLLCFYPQNRFYGIFFLARIYINFTSISLDDSFITEEFFLQSCMR